jgi:predicted metal-binding membrane protein
VLVCALGDTMTMPLDPPAPLAPSRPESRAALSRTTATALLALGMLVLAAWAALLLQAWRMGGDDAFLAALCRPGLGEPAAGWEGFLADWGATALLWVAMSLAMMLPTALPMVLSYDQSAARAGRGAPSPLWVAAGYAAVWLTVSLLAALLQAGWARLAPVQSLPPVIASVLAGAAVGAAGLYQFSEWKLACLAFCRHEVAPDAALRSRAGVFAVGIGQGLRCLGCCGAIMGMMLVAGFMNLFWMAGFALLMTLEKLSSGLWAPRAIGVALVALGLAVAVGGVGIAPILAWALG